MHINATLTISGPLDQLGNIATLIASTYPEGFTVTVEADEVDGYTVSRARKLLDALHPRQRALIKRVVLSGGIYELAEERDRAGGTLRGLTGPIAKHVKRLTSEGTLPDGTRSPVTTFYNVVDTQQAGQLFMDPDLVPVFARALGLDNETDG